MDAPVFFFVKKLQRQAAAVRNTLRSALYCSMIMVSIVLPLPLSRQKLFANEIVLHDKKKKAKQ